MKLQDRTDAINALIVITNVDAAKVRIAFDLMLTMKAEPYFEISEDLLTLIKMINLAK